MKKLPQILLMVLFLFAVQGFAANAPSRSWIAVSGKKDAIALRPLPVSGISGTWKNQGWLPPGEREFALWGESSALPHGEWSSLEYRFVPEKSGQIVLTLAGSYVQRKGQTKSDLYWINYDLISIEGASENLMNGDFEQLNSSKMPVAWNAVGTPKLLEDSDKALSGDRFICVWQQSYFTQTLNVEKGKTVIIKLNVYPGPVVLAGVQTSK